MSNFYNLITSALFSLLLLVGNAGSAGLQTWDASRGVPDKVEERQIEKAIDASKDGEEKVKAEDEEKAKTDTAETKAADAPKVEEKVEETAAVDNGGDIPIDDIPDESIDELYGEETSAEGGAEIAKEEDPFEPLNRGLFAFNRFVEKAIIRPISKVYGGILPKPAQESVDNFMQNLFSPLTFANYLLQGKGAEATTTVARFLINTTLGIGGLFDVAGKDFDIKADHTGFGQTLNVWGVKRGPYLMLPFLGPSTFRETIGTVTDWYSNPIDIYLRDKKGRRVLRYTYHGVRFINTYTLNRSEIERLEEESEDLYLAVRSFYLQNLKYKDKKSKGEHVPKNGNGDSAKDKKEPKKSDKKKANKPKSA